MRPNSSIRTALFSLLALSGALAPTTDAEAFCGFYVAGSNARLLNRATMVALMRDGQRTVLSMQNAYEGPVEDFAMVVPVPIVLERANVRTLPRAVFERLEELTAPRLVEYWEQDPCAQDSIGLGALGTLGRGAGGGSGQGYGSGAGALGVRIEAQFEVGEYNIVILSARDSAGLDTWLRQERYNIPQGAAEVLAPYVRAGMKFFVAKVDVRRVRFENGRAVLSPLRFHYDSESFALPVRLGLVNSPGAQDLIVHILAKNERYEAANRPNAFIPTNLTVNDGVRGQFAEFYNSLFDRTLGEHPGAVVTEYSWDSASCDPCPVPALTDSELATLGADVLPSTSSVVQQSQSGPGAPAMAMVPMARLAPATVTGPLAPEAVRRVMLRNINQLRFCYEQGLARNPNLVGRVVERFTVANNGTVSASQIAQTTLNDRAVEQCVASATRRWMFPATASPVTVEVPINFSQEMQSARFASGIGGRFRFGALPGFVLTRLHARYGSELNDDLVFRPASAVQGGREVRDPNGELELGARPAMYGGNTFQARYAIRHGWTGPIQCANPRRGVWGGPPGGERPATRSARGLGFAGRGLTGAALSSLIASGADGGATPSPAMDAGATSARPTPNNSSAPASAPSSAPAPARASGCSVPSGHGRFTLGSSLAALGLAMVSLARRSRARR
ncbi:MAG: DUF2330 domain-containing protein [Polyangiales bacterium]